MLLAREASPWDHDLRLTELDKVLVSSARLQSSDVQIGFAQLVIAVAPTAAVRGTVPGTGRCHLLRHIWLQGDRKTGKSGRFYTSEIESP